MRRSHLREDFLTDTKCLAREMAFPGDTTEAWNSCSRLATMRKSQESHREGGAGMMEPLDEPACSEQDHRVTVPGDNEPVAVYVVLGPAFSFLQPNAF